MASLFHMMHGDTLVNTARTECWRKKKGGPILAEHVLKPCGCSFVTAVTQCDKLTSVFKSLFLGHVSFCFKCSQCPCR